MKMYVDENLKEFIFHSLLEMHNSSSPYTPHTPDIWSRGQETINVS